MGIPILTNKSCNTVELLVLERNLEYAYKYSSNHVILSFTNLSDRFSQDHCGNST